MMQLHPVLFGREQPPEMFQVLKSIHSIFMFSFREDEPASSVSIRAGRPGDRGSIPAEKDLSCILCVQTGSGVHPASCTMGTAGPFPGDKVRPGRDADHSLRSSAEVENE
jgi:hypothetical protein